MCFLFLGDHKTATAHHVNCEKKRALLSKKGIPKRGEKNKDNIKIRGTSRCAGNYVLTGRLFGAGEVGAEAMLHG